MSASACATYCARLPSNGYGPEQPIKLNASIPLDEGDLGAGWAGSDRAHLEKLLDQALADSFPASDPVAVNFEAPAITDTGEERGDVYTGPPMPTAGHVAMTFGIVATPALGIGLMPLVFYSSRKGHD